MAIAEKGRFGGGDRIRDVTFKVLPRWPIDLIKAFEISNNL